MGGGNEDWCGRTGALSLMSRPGHRPSPSTPPVASGSPASAAPLCPPRRARSLARSAAAALALWALRDRGLRAAALLLIAGILLLRDIQTGWHWLGLLYVFPLALLLTTGGALVAATRSGEGGAGAALHFAARRLREDHRARPAVRVGTPRRVHR